MSFEGSIKIKINIHDQMYKFGSFQSFAFDLCLNSFPKLLLCPKLFYWLCEASNKGSFDSLTFEHIGSLLGAYVFKEIIFFA
jgi:hypothetical protein